MTELTVTFEEAIALTESLMEKMINQQLSPQETENKIATLVQSMNGARGFFVTYLTDERPLADEPSEAVIKALASSPEIVSDLLVKNLAMSSAMVLTHQRNHNQDLAASSQRVATRTTKLIQLLDLELIREKLSKLQDSLQEEGGEYQDFLKRWGYDSQQKSLINQAIEKV